MEQTEKYKEITKKYNNYDISDVEKVKNILKILITDKEQSYAPYIENFDGSEESLMWIVGNCGGEEIIHGIYDKIIEQLIRDNKRDET